MKFVGKPMGVDTYPFPKVRSNMVTQDLSKLTRLRPKVDLGQASETPKKDKYGKTPAITIYNLKP